MPQQTQGCVTSSLCVLGCKSTVFSLRFACRLKSLYCVFAIFTAFFFFPPLSGGLDLNSSNSGCARLGSGVAPPLGVVEKEMAVLIVFVRRHRRAVGAFICAELALSSTGTTSRFDVQGPPCAGTSLVSTGGARPVHGTTGTSSLVPGIVPLQVKGALGQSSFDDRLVA